MLEAINITFSERELTTDIYYTYRIEIDVGNIGQDPVGVDPGRRRKGLCIKGRCNYCVNSKSPQGRGGYQPVLQ